MTNIESIRNYFRSCPLLSGNKININSLPDLNIEYSIDTVPANPIVKRYVDGSSLRQIVFVFASREAYGADVSLAIQASGFYEDLSAWIETQSRNRCLPVLESGRQAQKMEATTDGYLFNADRTTARYQIQCRLEYLQGVDFNEHS